MEKEIKVRKRRFAAFWMTVLLVCGMVVPMAVNAEVDNGVLTDETTLEAGIKIRADKITYQDDKGNYLLTSSQEESGGWQTIKKYTDIQKDPLPEGYEFDVWEVTANSGNTMEYDNVQYPASVTLKAKTKIGTYTITFDTVGGSTIEPIKQVYNTAVTAPPAPTKTGYTFTGWQPEIPETMPAENLEITAQWNVNQYTITFDTDGGSAVDSITQDYNSTITKPADPTRENYYFVSWDKEIPATMPAEDMTITAKWTPRVIDAGSTYYLEVGNSYQLGSAKTVAGDSSTYADGAVFYVAQSGEYTFN